MRVATVLTACGIETPIYGLCRVHCMVATVLTACGIETPDIQDKGRHRCRLQQYLSFTVLKRSL